MRLSCPPPHFATSKSGSDASGSIFNAQGVAAVPGSFGVVNSRRVCTASQSLASTSSRFHRSFFARLVLTLCVSVFLGNNTRSTPAWHVFPHDLVEHKGGFPLNLRLLLAKLPAPFWTDASCVWQTNPDASSFAWPPLNEPYCLSSLGLAWLSSTPLPGSHG